MKSFPTFLKLIISIALMLGPDVTIQAQTVTETGPSSIALCTINNVQSQPCYFSGSTPLALTPAVPPGLLKGVDGVPATADASDLAAVLGSFDGDTSCVFSTNASSYQCSTTKINGVAAAAIATSPTSQNLTATAPYAGAVAVTQQQYNARTVNVRDFGAVCDGQTDAGPAFRAAFAVARTVRYDLEGCQSNYLINSTVIIPGGSALVGPGEGEAYPLGIRTTAAVDTFDVGGSQYAITDTRIEHDGSSGSAINAVTSQYGTISHNSFVSNSSGSSNTSPLVYIAGSLTIISQKYFTNYRTAAYSLNIDSSTAPTVVIHIDKNFFGSPGLGMLIGSSTGNFRPEGLYLTGNHCVIANPCLTINSVNDLKSVANSYDIGSTSQVILNSTGQGIDMVSFTDDYLSTLNQQTSGVCLSMTGVMSRIVVRSKFAYCGYGVASTDGNSSKVTIESSFVNIGNIAIDFQSVQGATLTDNNCSSCKYNLDISDGSAGGPYIVDENQWDASGGLILNETTPTNFRFGTGNSGLGLAGYSAATTATMVIGSPSCTALTIPHGLSGTPNLDKTILSPRTVSGTMTAVTATAAQADATNIYVQVCGNISSAGTVRVTVLSSL